MATPRLGRRSTVAVLGGGIAGLTAAHELVERGFDVTVYERRAWGGKARSTEVAGSATEGRRPLPGEHGWRVFFGFYQHLPDTMSRIPFGDNPHGVFDNLVAAPQLSFARDGGRHDLVLPLGAMDPRPYTADQIADLIRGLVVETHLPPDAVAHFVDRALLFLSSCDARRVGELEEISWSDFIGAHRFNDDYRKVLANPFTQFTQASKTERTSAQFAGHFLEALLYNHLGRGANGPLFRILDGPTNEAFLDPWTRLLEQRGVKLRLGCEITELVVQDDRVRAIRGRSPAGAFTAEADWVVCALPVERARRLWNHDVVTADPSLAGMNELSTAWMNGLKFFLREPVRIVRGHVACLDSPWAIEAISQSQFWRNDFAATYGDGTVRESLSAIIADWTTPGVLFGRPASDCTPAEIAAEVWEQLKRHVEDTGERVLDDDSLVRWDIDPGMLRVGSRLVSDDPLVLPAVHERSARPDVTTAIPNLLLAGDYLRSGWEVANMECANHNARRAVNAVLASSGSLESPCMVQETTYQPPEWEALKAIDAERYEKGQPNLFDTQAT